MAAELAQHFEEASDWARAVKYLQLEAEVAGRRYAPREAAAILQHALKLSGRLQEAERAATEVEILQKLAVMYVALSDTRLFETYEALISRAARAGLVEVEVQALIDITYPLSVISSQRCLDTLDRALRLSSSQKDSLMQARTRASCLVQKIWARGWNAQDAEECLNALAEIRKSDDRLLVAAHVIDCDFILWSSSRYREAKRNAIEGLAILMERSEENSYLSFAYNWLNQILPWTLLSLGEWGDALTEIRERIALADKNGNHSHGQALRLYQALVHINAMDFAGVVRICESVLPFLGDPGRGPWRRVGLILIGSAEIGLGNYESAQKHLFATTDEMGRETLLFDWYSRMMLESALTELWLAKGNLKQALTEAKRFLEATSATAERTWQALAWEANARVALAQIDLDSARDCIANALSTMEGYEVPLAAWRVHATAAELYRLSEKTEVAEHHAELSRAAILRLADSLPGEEPLRKDIPVGAASA